ncbi:uncharacterized protein LOC144481689 [Mustelus asterias]
MAKRQTLRSRVSLSRLKDDAQLNQEPKTPSPVATSRYTRLTRSTFKKVEDTPSQSSRCSNGAPATEIQEEAEKTSSRGSQSVTGSQKRDRSGRWLSRTCSGKPSRKSDSNSDSTQEENSPVQQTKSPSTESERTKELLKSVPRKSTRIAKQLKLDSPRSPISIEDVCPQLNASQPEESVDTNGGSPITEQNETRAPDLDARVEEELEVGKLDQVDVGMEKEEDKEGQSLCDISASFVLEPESLSVKISRSSTGSGRNSGKLRRKSVGNPESASVENSPVQQTKSPSTESESTKELLKSTPRKSRRIVKQLKLDSPRSPISIEDVCPQLNASQPEESVDTNGGSYITEQNEAQTPDLDTRVEEELEVGKLDQDDVEMEKEEGKEEQSLCDISASFKLEPKSLSGEDSDQSSTQNGRDSAQTEDALDTEASPRANFEDKQVQTVVWTIVASDVEDLKNEEPEGEDQLVAEDLSPKKPQGSARGESPPFRQARGTLGDGTGLVSEVPAGIPCGDRSLACEAMSGRQEAEAARRPEEEAPRGAGGHEGASCPGSPPPGSERGEAHRGLAKELANGEGRPALSPGVAVSQEEISSSLGGARGNGECVVECVQCPGGTGAVLTDVATAAGPDNARPVADARHRENASPIKRVNENGLAGQTSPASEIKAGRTDDLGSPASEIKAGRTDDLGSPASEMEAAATNPPASPLPDPDSGATGPPSELQPGGTGLPGSGVLETGATGTELPGSAVPEAGGTGFPGSFVSEAVGEGAHLPGVTVSETDGRATLLASKPESGEANGPMPAVSGSERPPSLNLGQGQKMANAEGPCASPQEPAPGSVAASVTCSLENGGASLPLTSAECAVRELEGAGTDLESLEEPSIGTGATEALDTREDSVALPPAGRAEEQTGAPASERRGASLEAEGDTVGDPSRVGERDGNAESEGARPGVPASIPTGERATPAGTGDVAVTPAPSADQAGPGDPETHRRSRRRRRRGRKSCSSVEADCESRGADVTSSDQGLQAAEMTIPAPPVGVVQTPHNGVKEPWSDVRAGDSYSEREKMIVGCNHSEKAGQSEVDIEEDISAMCLKVDKETCEVMGKQEMDKAATQEAAEEVGGGNDQAEDAATKPEQKVEEQNMKEREKTPKPAHHLIVSNLDTVRNFAELQIAIISFFMVRRLLVTSIRMKKSRKRGYVTFPSRKDVTRALKYNGEPLLGRALRLRRPQKISKPMATLLTKKSNKELVSLLRKKKKKRQAQARKTEEEGASPLQREKERIQEIMASEKSEEDEQEDQMPLTKRKIAEIFALSEEREGNSVSPPQKKKRRKKKKQQQLEMEGGLTEELVEEWSRVGSAVLLQKKKRPKNEEELVLSQQGAEEEEEHAACPKKKKKQTLSSWCLCIQKVKSQAALSELKKVIGDFLTGRSVAYKKIALFPDSCTACVEFYGENDLNEALQFGLSKILGQTARFSKVEKLGASVDASDPRTLCVKNLPSEVRARDLKKLLEGVTGVWVQECQELEKRFAYVTLESEKATAKALTESGVECKGVPIQLERVGQRRKAEERKILLMENLPYLLSKKYLRSVFPNAEAIRMWQNSQSQRVTYVGYKTVREARVALKEFRERGFPGLVTRVASMEERKAKPESKSGSPGAVRSLFMWGMSSNTTVKTLKSAFKEAVDARISQLAFKRFAVVDFRTAEEAMRAKEVMQYRTIDGHRLNIYFSKCGLGEQESVRSTHVT